MPWLETFTLSLGASVAKYIVKSWLGESLPNSMLGDLIDVLKEEGKKSGEQYESKRKIDRIGDQIGHRVYSFMEREGNNLDDNQRNAISLELARTLSKAQISSKLLVDSKLDAGALAQKLGEVNPQATNLFSATETNVYNLLLAETSKAIIEVATNLESFQHQFAVSVLQSQGQILESLEKLLAIPDEKSQRYENEYLQTVRNTLDRMEMFGVPQYDVVARKQNLTIAYISLEVNLPNTENMKNEESLNLTRKPGAKAKIDSERGTFEKQTMHNAPINQLLSQARRIVIRGYAGSGKTTLMRWIAVRSASRNFPAQLAGWNNTTPFFIPLREYVDSDFPEIESFTRYVARMLGGKPEDWVHQQLDSGRAIILIDGVDELPVVKRPEMLRRLNELINAYPFARYIVTSRPHALKADLWPEWPEWIADQGFVETVLQPMNNSCTEEFIDHWHAALKTVVSDEQEREELSANPDNLKRLLRRRPALRRLANNPLLCAMICALYRERRQSLPSERIKLYQECVEMLVSRREEHRMVGLRGDYPELNYSQQIALIQGFAYWLMHNSYSDVETVEADRHFDSRLPNLSLSGVNGENIRRLFVERASLLSEPVIGRINFAHRTFQEYLAARAAVEAGDFGFLQKNALDDQWQEVIILAAGEARPKERGRFLQGLISKADNLKRLKNQRQLYLLALACLETCVDLVPEVRGQVIERAGRLFPPKDDDEVKRIADAGEPAVELLSIRPRLQEDEAQRCIQALGMIGSDSALVALAKYAKDERFKSLDYVSAWDNFDRRLYAQNVLVYIPVLILDQLSSWDGFEYLSSLKELNVRNFSIMNLSPLISLSGLSQLSLGVTQYSDLTPIASMPNLVSLSLSGRRVTDLSPLASLPNLTQLSLIDTQVSDLSPLASLPNLTRLSLSGTQASNLSLLASLPNLTQLSLSDTQVSDLSPLASLPNLTQLSLSDTQVSGLSPRASLPSLTRLSLSGTQVSDLSLLNSLPNLTQLSLFQTAVSDLTPLASLLNLTQLSLFQTAVPDLTPLASLLNLTQFFIYTEMQVSDLSPLAALPNLTQLSLSATQGFDISPLASLPRLTRLSLGSAQVSNLSSIASIPNLTHLSLSSIQVSDFPHFASLSSVIQISLILFDASNISHLASLPNITELLLFGRDDFDLSPIASLPNLTQLSMKSTQISDLSPITRSKSLRTLNLNALQFYDLLKEQVGFPNLIGLDLSYNNLTSIELLINFPQILKLVLSRNWIKDLSPLVGLTRLVELDLSNTHITDITPLRALIELQELDISFTAVTDISPLVSLPKLRKLNIRHTPVQDLTALVHRSGLEIIR
jgi:Leucine-rich repeat (LRR) protein